MNALLDYFKPFLDFDRYDAESSTEGTLHLDCFIAVASGIGVSGGSVCLLVCVHSCVYMNGMGDGVLLATPVPPPPPHPCSLMWAGPS